MCIRDRDKGDRPCIAVRIPARAVNDLAVKIRIWVCAQSLPPVNIAARDTAIHKEGRFAGRPIGDCSVIGIKQVHLDVYKRQEFSKSFIVDSIVEGVRVYIVGMLDTRHADRMRTDPFIRFKMFRMHEKSAKFVFVQLQTEQHAESHIVDTALHGAVHSFGMIIIIMLGSGRMKLFIAFFMIGFLKQNVSADTGFFEFSVVFNGGSGNVDIDAANRSVFVLDGINGVDTIKNVLNRVCLLYTSCALDSTRFS